MKIKDVLGLMLYGLLICSCVSTKKLKKEELRFFTLDSVCLQLQKNYKNCNDTSRKYQALSRSLRARLAAEKSTNDQLLVLMKELSIISGSQAESIKKSLENISGKDAYIRDLQSALARKDSLNMVLVRNLKGAIGDLEDEDVNISIDKGVIYISISDKLLFETGRYEVTTRAREVLGKVARVLLNQPSIEFMVEGHTDSVPFKQGVLLDNWDLSVKRATSVIRILQYQYGIPPVKMTAAGRGEYLPLASNSTSDGRAINRRTRIVILPELDQFFKLLERPMRTH